MARTIGWGHVQDRCGRELPPANASASSSGRDLHHAWWIAVSRHRISRKPHPAVPDGHSPLLSWPLLADESTPLEYCVGPIPSRITPGGRGVEPGDRRTRWVRRIPMWLSAFQAVSGPFVTISSFVGPPGSPGRTRYIFWETLYKYEYDIPYVLDNSNKKIH